ANQIKVYKCPADKIPAYNGPRLRTYSMNSQMGAVYSPPNYSPGWRIYIKVTDLSCPTVSDAFIFADEHPDSINDGFLQLGLNSPYDFPDVPGALHGNVGSFSFADGHTGLKKWFTSVLNIPVRKVHLSHVPAAATNPDWQWVRDH